MDHTFFFSHVQCSKYEKTTYNSDKETWIWIHSMLIKFYGISNNLMRVRKNPSPVSTTLISFFSILLSLPYSLSLSHRFSSLPLIFFPHSLSPRFLLLPSFFFAFSSLPPFLYATFSPPSPYNLLAKITTPFNKSSLCAALAVCHVWYEALGEVMVLLAVLRCRQPPLKTNIVRTLSLMGFNLGIIDFCV